MPAKKYLSKINKDGNDICIKDAESQKALFYKDIYIGAATQSPTIKTDPYHYDIITKGSLVSITASSQKIWLIFQSTADTPNVFMSGMEVTMILHGTTTIDDVEYKVYKSESPFTGTFNVQLF